ncbi:hypothetical protein CSING_04790 [Corynebacterium singulare]|uniref:Uncharacterized protein n=1 Tax=Corynebacterium singulare TaxID=161899 RepID=A0A0B6EZY0_9CORY|nr:hypothetical protein CSING_04790 [Corynebacterium singulare]
MSGLTHDIVMTMIKEGYRQSDIAREYGVSRQYVSKLAKQSGYISSMTIINDNLPWRVDSDFQKNSLYQSLRLIAHYNLEGEDAFVNAKTSRRKAQRLAERLIVFRQVIDYNPAYPAIPGIVNTPGFAYVPRTESDEDFIIKIRPDVRVTTIGDRIWRLPEIP